MAVKRTKKGKIDKRTKEGKEMCERMAKAREVAAKKRAKEKSFFGRVKKLLNNYK